MASVTTRLRTRLDSLWKAVVNVDTAALGQHSAVQDDVLRANNVRLVHHQFKITDDESTYLSYVPPILFAPIPQAVIEDHPIDLDQCFNSLYGDYQPSIDLKDYQPPNNNPGANGIHRSDLHCPQALFAYLRKFAFGGYPRKRMPGVVRSLAKLSHIIPVYDEPNTLFLLSGFSGWTNGKSRGASIYEYETKDDSTYLPHVIILSRQSEYGHDGSIIQGELIQLITAMRNRANQPASKPSEEDEEIEPQETRKFFFKYEQRFPVLMVSCVGPQHARIYYACMDSSEVVIRQSSLYSFEDVQNAPFDFFASFLSSRWLEECDLDKSKSILKPVFDS